MPDVRDAAKQWTPRRMRAEVVIGRLGLGLGLALGLCSCSAKPAAEGGGGLPLDAMAVAPVSGGSVAPRAPAAAGRAGAVAGATASAAGSAARSRAGSAQLGGAGLGGAGLGGAGQAAGASQAGASGAGEAGRAGALARPADAATSGAAAGAAASPPSAAAIALPSELHGVNWADKRDNFVHGLLQLSGLDSSSDSYDSVKAKTSQIVTQFRDQLGANTIRIPINEPTVSSAWWEAYKAVIDTTTALDMNVIVAYWAYTAGKPDDEAAFKAMWQKVVADYPDNQRVFFDIHNEPSGFSAAAWKEEAARWLGYFPKVPRARVIVAGTGSDTDVVPLGADSRFDGCILQLHYYAFWHKDWTMQKQWRDAVTKALGSYASRTIVGEWGADMATGLDYDTKTPDGDSSIAYITAMADLIREHKMGSCYWPGLRDGDSYSLMKRDANSLSVVNESGRNRLRWAWNY